MGGDLGAETGDAEIDPADALERLTGTLPGPCFLGHAGAGTLQPCLH